MLDLHSLTFSSFDVGELAAVRAVGRVDRSFDGLVATLVRVQFLRAAMGSALGTRGQRGLALIEAFFLFLLAAAPATDDGQIRLKAVLFRCGCPLEGGDNADAMLGAALENDCLRLVT